MPSNKKNRRDSQKSTHVIDNETVMSRKPDRKPDVKKRDFVQVCSSIICEKTEGLRSCARCKAATYCSSTCQREDWPKHKEQCQLQQRLRDELNITEESTLSRSLRHFTTRFESTFVDTICGLFDVRNHPENVDNLALMMVVIPQKTPKAGRFILEQLIISHIEDFVESMYEIDPKTREVFNLHEKIIEDFKKENPERHAYATMAVVAKNQGPGMIPGDMPLIFRFKPLALPWPLLKETPTFADPEINWGESLRRRIENDMPA